MAQEGSRIEMSAKAAADLSSSQYYAVRLDETSGQIKLGNATSGSMGILTNNPVTNRAGSICVIGQTKGVCSGTVTVMDRLAADDSGHLVVTTTDVDEYVAIALGSRTGASSSILSVFAVGPTTLSHS